MDETTTDTGLDLEIKVTTVKYSEGDGRTSADIERELEEAKEQEDATQ